VTTQPKPLASLSSTLLARKGTARPAMRPQGMGGGFGHVSQEGPGHEDLGWNDMGSPESTVPPVLVAREELRTEIERVPVTPVSVATATRIGRESAKMTTGKKAAFTLRLDADRHLRLRLASALTNLSSQALVSQALDTFLLSLPEVDALVAQLPPSKTDVR